MAEGENIALPRVVIQFCTQCRWMLRAAYYAQELLSTFSTALGEVALQPSTGGTFTVNIYSAPAGSSHAEALTQRRLIWDRKTDGGFPETKELKRRIRDVIEPGRDLGHVDRTHGEKEKPAQRETITAGPSCSSTQAEQGGKPCEDCV